MNKTQKIIIRGFQFLTLVSGIYLWQESWQSMTAIFLLMWANNIDQFMGKNE